MAARVEGVISAAQNNPHAQGGGIFSDGNFGSRDNKIALAEISMGGNMFEPSLTEKKLPAYIASLKSPPVLADIQDFFGAQKFFIYHPANFATFQRNASSVAQDVSAPSLVSVREITARTLANIYRASMDDFSCGMDPTAPPPVANKPCPLIPLFSPKGNGIG